MSDPAQEGIDDPRRSPAEEATGSIIEPLDGVNAKTRLAYNRAAGRYHDLFHDELKDKLYDRALLDGFAGRCGGAALVLDAGCGPCGHIGRYVHEKGPAVVGVDISEDCLISAAAENPDMAFGQSDLSALGFKDEVFDGIIAFYSILDTPKHAVGGLFQEFRRILKPDGLLLLAVKTGTTEGFLDEILGLKTPVYFSLFSPEEIRDYFVTAGFAVEFLETRAPNEKEIPVDRIYARGRRE